MGHMKAVRLGTWSTKISTSATTTSDDDNDESTLPLEAPRSHIELSKNHQAAFGVIDLDQATNIKGLVCTDLPGRFPYSSSNRNNYIFVLYDFDSNIIIGKAIKSRNADELVRGYKICYDELREGNITPILHRLDNEVNDKLFEAIRNNNCDYQLVTVYDHRQNLAERAIQTYKNHFISVLFGTDVAFPAHLWCSLQKQINIQINLLR